MYPFRQHQRRRAAAAIHCCLRKWPALTIPSAACMLCSALFVALSLYAGHPDAQLHSGDGAVIAPLVVTSLAKRCVAAVAAAKHHTVLCTTAGEVFTMGSNRHGQLGYAVDGQPTPRRVSSLRQRVVAVAAANKHSVAVTAQGDVYTWGANVLGQLGYGTSDSAANPAPRLVEAMRGKAVVAAAAAKRHTLVLTAGGEVFTWGHRGVSPRRVQLAGARDVLSAEGTAMTFHRGHADVARPLAAAICAGAAHSSALTRAGVVLSWRSADPALQLQEVGGSLAGKRIVSISAGASPDWGAGACVQQAAQQGCCAVL